MFSTKGAETIMSSLRTPFGYLRVRFKTNIFMNDRISGYSTRFEDFTIWSAV